MILTLGAISIVESNLSCSCKCLLLRAYEQNFPMKELTSSAESHEKN